MQSRISTQGAAFGLALLAISSGAHAETYICQDENGKRDIVKVDIPTKTASLTSAGCTFSFRDGTTSPLGQSTACMFLVTGDPLKQFVSVRNGAVTFGARDDEVTVSYTLDLTTGLLDIHSSGSSGVNEEECHRPHV